LPLQGFGYLIPSFVQSPLLGCIWDSSIFPQHNHNSNQTRLTVMLRGTLALEEETEIIHIALKHVRQALSIVESPQFIEVRKSIQAIPQYFVGYSEWKKDIMATLAARYPKLILSGNAWGGVSVNDCVAAAKRIPELIRAHHF
jgi:protoporphyrinogen/coproporphyrinogen III oxidase